MAIREMLKNVWNAFRGRDPTERYYWGGSSGSVRPDRTTRRVANIRSVVSAIYTRIAVDCMSVDIRHVRVDENERYVETIDDSLNQIFSRSANLDQTGRAFVNDAILSMFDEGVIALLPVDTISDPNLTESYKVLTARVAKILEWFPDAVRLEAYNELTGQKEQVIYKKKCVPIIENPFYAIMNEPNSTHQRLIRVLNQLDRINEQNSAGKMDLIIQLPYVIKSDARKQMAEERRQNIEAQLTGTKYGIAYIDGQERVIQLNRAVENNLWAQVKDLTEELFNEMGLSKAIFDGTADEAAMLNYQNRTIEPILSAFVEEIERKWLSRTAIAQKQRIQYFKNPFKLVPVAQLAEIADKFTRNCIMTSNEIRSVIGMKPSDDPNADKLINANLNQPEEDRQASDIQNGKEIVEKIVKEV